MIGIVVVSHSDKIATGIVDVAKQVAGSEIPIAAAGGTPDGRIGTDAMAIKSAIESVDQGDGVIIFADLGSAILSAETAIDFIEGIQVEIMDAPIVEGVVSCAVQLTITQDMDIIRKTCEESKKFSKI